LAAVSLRAAFQAHPHVVVEQRVIQLATEDLDRGGLRGIYAADNPPRPADAQQKVLQLQRLER